MTGWPAPGGRHRADTDEPTSLPAADLDSTSAHTVVMTLFAVERDLAADAAASPYPPEPLRAELNRVETLVRAEVRAAQRADAAGRPARSARARLAGICTGLLVHAVMTTETARRSALDRVLAPLSHRYPDGAIPAVQDVQHTLVTTHEALSRRGNNEGS